MPALTDSESRVKRATSRRAQADSQWRDAIRAAHKAGVSLRKLAPLAGVSHQRLSQILNE